MRACGPSGVQVLVASTTFLAALVAVLDGALAIGNVVWILWLFTMPWRFRARRPRTTF